MTVTKHLHPPAVESVTQLPSYFVFVKHSDRRCYALPKLRRWCDCNLPTPFTTRIIDSRCKRWCSRRLSSFLLSDIARSCPISRDFLREGQRSLTAAATAVCSPVLFPTFFLGIPRVFPAFFLAETVQDPFGSLSRHFSFSVGPY